MKLKNNWHRLHDGLKRHFFVTGPPGVGKTTIILKTVDILRKMGFKVGGMLSREVRHAGIRIGFEVIDLETGQKGWLAHIDQPEGPRVSKYGINLKDLENIGAGSILRALNNAQIIVVDEVGPMELHSQMFKKAVAQAINSEKPVLGVVHYRARDSLIGQLRKRDDIEILEVTHGNRTYLHNLIIEKVAQFLNGSQTAV